MLLDSMVILLFNVVLDKVLEGRDTVDSTGEVLDIPVALLILISRVDSVIVLGVSVILISEAVLLFNVVLDKVLEGRDTVDSTGEVLDIPVALLMLISTVDSVIALGLSVLLISEAVLLFKVVLDKVLEGRDAVDSSGEVLDIPVAVLILISRVDSVIVLGVSVLLISEAVLLFNVVLDKVLEDTDTVDSRGVVMDIPVVLIISRVDSVTALGVSVLLLSEIILLFISVLVKVLEGTDTVDSSGEVLDIPVVLFISKVDSVTSLVLGVSVLLISVAILLSNSVLNIVLEGTDTVDSSDAVTFNAVALLKCRVDSVTS
ncbi:hypothetical protein QYM36_015959 [Artemia franciscana]|uniref:Uncharacterized protein n=1 Tax=Artemia franciscana TaxID=6661 RepID=A0AA88L2V3_ARTSF|nr:hypothetical protein QYM36_015959 [Artemia franciscana]